MASPPNGAYRVHSGSGVPSASGPYGQGAEQCLLFVAVAGVLLFRGGWRRLHALRAARDEDRQSEPDRARKPVRPARNRARRR